MYMRYINKFIYLSIYLDCYCDLLRQLSAQIKKTYIQQEMTTKKQILTYTYNHTKLYTHRDTQMTERVT